MTQYKLNPSPARGMAPPGEDLTLDYRARLAHQQAEAVARRRFDLAEQSSNLKTAEERIRIWERIHEVGLPRDQAHNLVDIIASDTGLTQSSVREEQQRRAAIKAVTPV